MGDPVIPVIVPFSHRQLVAAKVLLAANLRQKKTRTWRVFFFLQQKSGLLLLGSFVLRSSVRFSLSFGSFGVFFRSVVHFILSFVHVLLSLFSMLVGILSFVLGFFIAGSETEGSGQHQGNS
jgi:uncharacterized membrane protein YozB (DUF420 family)